MQCLRSAHLTSLQGETRRDIEFESRGFAKLESQIRNLETSYAKALKDKDDHIIELQRSNTNLAMDIENLKARHAEALKDKDTHISKLQSNNTN